MNKDEMIKEIYETLSRVSQTARTFDAVAYRLYTENCRIIADDEIVIKKSKIGMLEKTIDYLEMEKAQLNKQLEQAKQETAREIFRELKIELKGYIGLNYLDRLAKKYGIELED